jgi:ABC-type transporter Mla subunit MlaD
MTVAEAQAIVGNMPQLTQGFVAAIVFLTIIFHIAYGERTIAYAPTILTTTGIFATFLGIALGLADFDTTNVQASVPALLEGLKTAFWASVFGVGGALTLKIRYFVFGLARKERGSGPRGETTAKDIADNLRAIQQALVGNDDSTLVSQIKLSRADSNERLDALKKAQTDALQKLSELSSKHLVEALRDVIKDFNAKITEQFGENFKHLNEAVGRLLLWQEQYKAQIESITQQQSQIANSMDNATRAYGTLVDKAGTFTQLSEQLSVILSALETQKNQLNSALKSLGDLLLAASGSLPQIEKKVVELTSQLTSAVNENQKEINKALSENSTIIRNSIQTVGQDFANTNKEFNRQVAELTAKTKEQVSVLDAALSEELKKSLESLGRQLAALSEKFVSDYMPLTERLRALVQMAAR